MSAKRTTTTVTSGPAPTGVAVDIPGELTDDAIDAVIELLLKAATTNRTT